MSRFDKCEICDYNEAEGSEYSGAAPGSQGSVRFIHGHFYCGTCANTILLNLQDLRMDYDPDVDRLISRSDVKTD